MLLRILLMLAATQFDEAFFHHLCILCILLYTIERESKDLL